MHVQKLGGRREGEREFCPARLQQLSLSAQLQSFSSLASPVSSGDWSRHILSQSPKMSRIKHLGAVQRLDPGVSRLQAGSCEQQGDGSLAMPATPGSLLWAWASPPGAPTDLLHTFLPAVINLPLRSIWHQSIPHLGEAMSCNEKFSDHPLPYICFWLCHWCALCM